MRRSLPWSALRGSRARGSADVSEYVRLYVKAQKNDDRDAEGIAEAASRPAMRFVDLKSKEQLDIQSLHRVRSCSKNDADQSEPRHPFGAGRIFSAGRCKFESALDALPR